MSGQRALCVIVTTFLFGLLLPAMGCDRPAATRDTKEGSPTGNGVTIDFVSTPDPPRSGDNRLEVTVKRPDGLPVTDAAVTAVFSMLAMPTMNMPAMRSEASLQHVGDGRYRGTGRLSMAGTWNVAVEVVRAGKPLGTRTFSVVAK